MSKKVFKNKFILLLAITIIVFLFTNSVARADLISTEQEVQLGTEAASQLEGQYGLYDDQYLLSWVTQVGNRVAYVSPREGITYRFQILNTGEPNALAIPGGFIYVTRGILQDFVRNDEDYLAVILGHEIGHVNMRHGIKQLEWSMGIGVLLQVLLGKDTVMGDIAQLASGLVFLKYGRDQELEADQYGMETAHKAGYDHRALIRFFKDLKQYEATSPSSSPEFLASHPDTDSRIEDAEKVAAEIEGNTYATTNQDGSDNYQSTPSHNSDNSDNYQSTPSYDSTNTFGGDLTGTWEASLASPIMLVQSGNKVTGTYQNGKGFLEGTIEGDKLNYEWRDLSGSDRGTGYFYIASDGDSLVGQYSSAGNNGDWKAWRKNYTSNPTQPQIKTYNISGTWQSSLGGEITLVQDANSVEGTFGKGKGRIKGTLSDNRLEFEWYESVDKEGGTGYFIISDDANSMSGEWTSQNGATGVWNASR